MSNLKTLVFLSFVGGAGLPALFEYMEPGANIGDAPRTVSISRMPKVTLPGKTMITGQFSICSSAKRVNCIVDGDTLWIKGEKIRLVEFDTPEVNGRCSKEKQLADKATRKLQALLNSGGWYFEGDGKDVYARSLGTLQKQGRNIADAMISSGLARPYHGRKTDWCV